MEKSRSFREFAGDSSAFNKIEEAVAKLITAKPKYARITEACQFLAVLHPGDFPAALNEDVQVVFSVFQHIQRYNEFLTGSHIPPALRSRWMRSLMNIYTHIPDRTRQIQPRRRARKGLRGAVPRGLPLFGATSGEAVGP
jgi:hypothetical protein